MTVASVGRDTPGRRRHLVITQAWVAPVLPAETNAWASPFLTRSAATASEEFFSSSDKLGRFVHFHDGVGMDDRQARVQGVFTVQDAFKGGASPTRTTSSRPSVTARIAPLTSGSGPKSPAMASSAMRMRGSRRSSASRGDGGAVCAALVGAALGTNAVGRFSSPHLSHFVNWWACSFLCVRDLSRRLLQCRLRGTGIVDSPAGGQAGLLVEGHTTPSPPLPAKRQTPIS